MSNLVNYGSSDEEDTVEDVQQQGSSTKSLKVEKLHRGASAEDPNAMSEQLDLNNARNPAEGPMIGPTTAANGSSTADAERDQSPDDIEQMSERDTIRYLTQTTHPMTSMPSSPPGSPDPAANARFRRFLELKSQSVHFNEDLARKSTFKNPSLLSTMMSRVGIANDAQYGTSLPPQLWDPTGFPGSAYKEELLKSQQEIREKEVSSKKLLSAAGKRTINFASPGRSGNSSRDSTPSLYNKRRRP